jgi:predicted DCC family thiol-disulfide oxidoreductase YuxK
MADASFRRASLQVFASGAETRGVLLYDQDCGFCQRWVEWSRRRNPRGVEFKPCQPESHLRQRARISDRDCLDAAHYVELRDGSVVNVRRGAGAINELLRRMAPGWRVLSLAYEVPGLRAAQDVGYAWVARNRHRFGPHSCAVDSTAARPGKRP